MRKGKYVDATFTKEQKRARRLHQQALDDWCNLCDALMCVPDDRPREELHKRLDQALDTIEKKRQIAKELFPDVSESFTISEGTMRL
ncbi:hypothetical protein LCGC14_0367530 [marine sediment metagenome]|uniref:Uncharacterized protein n=1 Tax=marine sediment metagenome TaxID=412755 RepID=A0A0F9TPC1_9ZZZZ